MNRYIGTTNPFALRTPIATPHRLHQAACREFNLNQTKIGEYGPAQPDHGYQGVRGQDERFLTEAT
jgi:hypothetical protein